MKHNHHYPHNFSVEETEDGYAIHIKGDKEKLKAKMEAFEAYRNFKEKAKAAGFSHHHNSNGHHGFFSLIHKHIQAFHKHNHNCTEQEEVK